MYFKKFKYQLSLLFAVILISLGLISCRLPWGEKPVEPPPTQTKIGAEARCLSSFFPTFKEYLNGHAQAQEVSAGWRCLEGALEVFKVRVRGQNPDVYQAAELKSFFEQFFLTEGTVISDTLMHEFMQLKRILLGGNDQQFTRTEVDALIQLSKQLDNLTLTLLPHIKIFTKDWKPTDSDQDQSAFEAARVAIEMTFVSLSALIEAKNQSYEISHLGVLFEELSKAMGESWAFVPKLKLALPVFGKLKKTLMGTPENAVLPNEWRNFGLLGIRSYLIYLRYGYFIVDRDQDQAADFKQIFMLLDDLLVTSGEFISQKPRNRIEQSEIQEVLDEVKNVFPDLVVKAELLTELMKLKQLLVGGSRQEFTPEDFKKARSKLGSIKLVVELYNQNREIFSGRWHPEKLSTSEANLAFSLAENDLKKISEVLSGVFESGYDLADGLNLLRRLEESFPGSPNQKPISETVEEYFPLIISLKSVILNDWTQSLAGKESSPGIQSSSVVAKEDWSRLLKSSVEILARGLQIKYFLAKNDFLSEGSLGFWSEILNRLAPSYEVVLTGRGRGNSMKPIKNIELSRLFQIMQNLKLINFDWPAVTIEDLLAKLTSRILVDPSERKAKPEKKELSLANLKIAIKELQIIVNTQDVLYRALKSQSGQLSHAELQSFLSGKAGGAEEMSRFLARGHFIADPQGRIQFTENRNLFYDEATLVRMNLMRAAARLAIRSYRQNVSQIDRLPPLVVGEVKNMYFDLKPIFVKMDLIEEANVNFYKNRFIEANLFTYFGNGDDFLSFEEMTSEFMLITSGLNIQKLLAPIYDTRCMPNSKDRIVTVPCAVGVEYAETSRVFSNMPRMVSYIQSLSESDVRSIYTDLIASTGWIPNANQKIKMVELGLFPHIVQYVESIFVRFDSDKNGQLNEAEAMRALPIFTVTLAKVSGFKDPQWIRALFAYILIYGEAPESVTDQIYFVTYWVNQDHWDIKADRNRISRILGFIASALRKGTNVPNMQKN